MALPTNALQNVVTYQDSGLAFMENYMCIVSSANTKFREFNTSIPTNLGSTVSFDLTPRFSTGDGLVISIQGSEQRVQTLTVDTSKHVAYAFSAEQFIFNVEDYMEKFGRSAGIALGTKVEENVALNFLNHTYRCYGDGVTAVNSFSQLSEALALFRNYSAVLDQTKFFLPDMAVPAIVQTGLNQFSIDRNNEMTKSWMIGNYDNCEFYRSNLLPIHTAGTIGDDAVTLTVTETNDPTGANITAITFSGAGTDADAIKKNDILEFQDGVSGQPNLRFLTFQGYVPSANKVQLRATANAASSGGNVTVSISPALSSVLGKNQNILHNIVAGMQVKVRPSHRAGCIMSGNPLFVAMPALPDQSPYITANKANPETGISMRMYWGTKFGQNEQAFVHDAMWGSTMVDEMAMRVIFPV